MVSSNAYPGTYSRPNREGFRTLPNVVCADASSGSVTRCGRRSRGHRCRRDRSSTVTQPEQFKSPGFPELFRSAECITRTRPQNFIGSHAEQTGNRRVCTEWPVPASCGAHHRCAATSKPDPEFHPSTAFVPPDKWVFLSESSVQSP